MMISLTSKNGITVRLDAEYDIEKEVAEYRVTYGNTRLFFPVFKDAAIIFKTLSEDVEKGCEMDESLATLEGLYGKKEVK